MENKELDILVTGCSRSGTTLVANLLTHGPNWCMAEPVHNEYVFKDRVKTQAKDLGIHMKDLKIIEMPFRVRNLQKWGVKEIKPNRRELMIKLFNPKIVIVCVRRIQDIVISHLNFSKTKMKEMNQCLNYFWIQTTQLFSFINGITQCGTQIVYIQYEQLTNSRYVSEKSIELGWPLSGNPDKWLDMYGRSDEKRGVIQTRQHDITEETYTIAERTAEACQLYQKLFGYIDRLPGEKI